MNKKVIVTQYEFQEWLKKQEGITKSDLRDIWDWTANENSSTEIDGEDLEEFFEEGSMTPNIIRKYMIENELKSFLLIKE